MPHLLSWLERHRHAAVRFESKAFTLPKRMFPRVIAKSSATSMIQTIETSLSTCDSEENDPLQ